MRKFLLSKKRKAVSLYELLIVMSIIALVSAITIPMVRNFLPPLRLSSSAKEVSTKLRQAQEEAVTTQIKHGIKFNVSSPSTPASIDFFKYIDPSPPNPAQITVIEHVDFSQNITLAMDPAISGNTKNPDSIIFSADGGPDVNGNIVIGLTDYSSKTINVSPAGVIKLLQ